MIRRARGAQALIGLVALAPAGVAHGEGLQRELDAALSGVERATVLVEPLGGGEPVYARDADVARTPASNMKLLTTAAALGRLGEGFQHRTRVAAGGTIEDGVLRGDLWVVGGGDPTISRRFDAEPLLADVAAAVAARGVRRVTGDLVFDARAFDDQRHHPTWSRADRERWYGAAVSALSLNDNCVDVEVRGGPTPQVTLHPATAYLHVDPRASATDRRDRHRFSVDRAGADRRTLRIAGHVWTQAGAYETSIPVPDPARYFATVLRERLEAAGVALEGQVRPAGGGEVAPAAADLWSRAAPLPRTLGVTNRRSQNFYAECLLKTLGRIVPGSEPARLGAGGSWDRGAAVAERFAVACGAPADQVRVRDGSGLSRENRLSARALVAVLQAVARAPYGEVYRGTLARPGGDGTLRRRLKDLPPGVTLQAKTGTLSGVASLSGYLTAGEEGLVFAVILNGKGAGRRVADRFVRALAGTLRR